jgi:hypothetical protein
MESLAPDSSRVEISPRLLPGVRVGGAWLSVKDMQECDPHGKPRWAWFLDLPTGRTFQDTLLFGWGNAQEMLADLVGFLAAWANAIELEHRAGIRSDNRGLFPDDPELAGWASGAEEALEHLAYCLENPEPRDE